MEENHAEPMIVKYPIILDDAWTVNLRNTIQKEEIMISKESKEFILKQQKERLSVVESGIERVQMNLSHYGKQMHDLVEERRKIKEAVYDLEHGTDIPDEEDES